jgi:hypothetical protein
LSSIGIYLENVGLKRLHYTLAGEGELTMTLLHIYDASDSSVRQTVEARTYRGSRYTYGISNDPGGLLKALDELLADGKHYERVLFETHGSPGAIYLGGYQYTAGWLRAVSSNGYTNITTGNARVYFNGCNVAADSAGWDFLEAAAGLFLNPGGGEVFGQTSLGFANPFNGHVVHLWGSTRTLFVDASGRITERFEQ